MSKKETHLKTHLVVTGNALRCVSHLVFRAHALTHTSSSGDTHLEQMCLFSSFNKITIFVIHKSCIPYMFCFIFNIKLFLKHALRDSLTQSFVCVDAPWCSGDCTDALFSCYNTLSLTTHWHACVVDSIPSSMKTESIRSGFCQKEPSLPLLPLAVHLSCATSLKQCEVWHKAGRTAPHHRTSHPPGFLEPLATERRASWGLPADLPVSRPVLSSQSGATPSALPLPRVCL